MRVSGYNVVMTRSEDVMLDTGESKGSAKMRDLKRRLEISSEYSDAITVSIHCNKFPQSSCKGMQVYHSDSQTAQAAAKLVQSSYLALMPENHRQIKKADSSIYLLDRAVSPAILVECGFLSNSEELQKLKDENYQKKLAIIIITINEGKTRAIVATIAPKVL
jgi:N-acetylmuramoyl-L-alanine amidase